MGRYSIACRKINVVCCMCTPWLPYTTELWGSWDQWKTRSIVRASRLRGQQLRRTSQLQASNAHAISCRLAQLAYVVLQRGWYCVISGVRCKSGRCEWLSLLGEIRRPTTYTSNISEYLYRSLNFCPSRTQPEKQTIIILNFLLLSMPLHVCT